MLVVTKTVCIFLFVFIIFYVVTKADENGYIGAAAIKAIKSDMPSFIDLMIFLPLLNRIVDFCEKNDKIMTLNLAHGLFLMNVNLEPFIRDEDIPAPIRNDLDRMVARSTRLKDGFNSGNGIMRRRLAILTEDSTRWSSQLPKLNFNLLKRTYVRGEYPSWRDYVVTVDNIFKGTPNPKESDACVASLTDVPLNLNIFANRIPRCNLPENCTNIIINGTDFGYWLTHRYILLSMARLSRGCAIFSPQEDKLFRLSFCEKAYREAQYIAMNGYQILDLMLEQIALCSIDGHAQFLRRSWLMNLLEYQQTSGCFQLDKVRRYSENVTRCDDHATGVGAATYAAAARLLLEKMKRFMLTERLDAKGL